MIATALGLWGTLVMLFAAPLALTGPVTWRQAVSLGGSYWALWLLFLPAVVWLSFRFPIERQNFLRNVALHLLVCLMIVGAGRVTFNALATNFPRSQRLGAPGRPPDPRRGRSLEAPGGPGVFHDLRATRCGNAINPDVIRHIINSNLRTFFSKSAGQ